MSQLVEILNSEYEVLDALNNITLADSFLKNKTGTGNGEAKLYVDNISDELNAFFDNFKNNETRNGFFLKMDYEAMLFDLSDEFGNPQQRYFAKITESGKRKIIDVTHEMPNKWNELSREVGQTPDVLDFEFFRSPVRPPRIY